MTAQQYPIMTMEGFLALRDSLPKSGLTPAQTAFVNRIAGIELQIVEHPILVSGEAILMSSGTVIKCKGKTIGGPRIDLNGPDSLSKGLI